MYGRMASCGRLSTGPRGNVEQREPANTNTPGSGFPARTSSSPAVTTRAPCDTLLANGNLMKPTTTRLGILVSCATLFAQNNTGRILGSVYDRTEAVIANATATITDTERGSTGTLATNQFEYNAPNLVPGVYLIPPQPRDSRTSRDAVLYWRWPKISRSISPWIQVIRAPLSLSPRRRPWLTPLAPC
jgi:hypothetical protein